MTCRHGALVGALLGGCALSLTLAFLSMVDWVRAHETALLLDAALALFTGGAIVTAGAALKPTPRRYLALFEGDPEGGGREATYPGYYRRPVRGTSEGGWGPVDGAGTDWVTFPEAGAAAAARVTHFAVVTAAAGGTVVESGEVHPPQRVSAGVTVQWRWAGRG